MSVIEDYIQANQNYMTAKERLKACASALSAAGSALTRTPENFCFANCEVGLPVDIAMNSRTQKVDAKEWPTPNQIQQAILDRFNAKRAVQAAWENIPESMRAAVVPPKL